MEALREVATVHAVMAGPAEGRDPAIHRFARFHLSKRMDARVFARA
jgi:hypothetical protein